MPGRTVPHEELLRRVREQGDAAAAEALILGQLDRIYSICLAMVRDPDRAGDLAQDTVVRLFTTLDRYRGDCSWNTWTFRIARNLCLNWREKMREEGGDDGATLRARDGDPLDAAVTRQRSAALRAALDALDPQEREALLLHYEAGLPVQQITELMGLENRSGARGVLQRARRKLRGAVADALPDDTIVRNGPLAPARVREAAERTLHELTGAPQRDGGREPALRPMATRQRLID